MKPMSPDEQAQQAMDLALRHAFAGLDPLCGFSEIHSRSSVALVFDDEDWGALAFEITEFLPTATLAVELHQPPGCKWHDHGADAHLSAAAERLLKETT